MTRGTTVSWVPGKKRIGFYFDYLEGLSAVCQGAGAPDLVNELTDLLKAWWQV